MNRDCSIPITKRMASNIEYFSNKVRDEEDKEAMRVMVELFSELLNDILKAKFVQSFSEDNEMGNIAMNQTSSFGAKIESCYQFGVIGPDVRAILNSFDDLKEDFVSFNEFNARKYIQRIIDLSKSELFDLILNLIAEHKVLSFKCDKLDDLIDIMGFRGTLQFIFAVLCAALLENLLNIQKS